MDNFLAIDFQLADRQRDSACSVALVKVTDGRIIKRGFYLIQPPRKRFLFTYMHGITWEDVKESPDFPSLWPVIRGYFEDIKFLAAHNISLDRSVLQNLCETYGIEYPDIPFRCTMKLARDKWDIHPTKLPDVCEKLGIRQNLEHPASHAEACAEIMIRSYYDEDDIGFRNIEPEIPERTGTQIRVLGSTSSGNSTVVWNEDSALMIDCGFTKKYTEKSLEEIGLGWNDISGLVITHVHNDHLNGPVFNALYKHGIPVYFNPEIGKYLAKHFPGIEKAYDAGLVTEFDDTEFTVGSFTVRPFEVPHDSHGGCFGYNIYSPSENGLKKVTISTDMAYSGNGMYKNFIDSDVIIIESNHDVDMLMSSSRSYVLKRRIIETGHLSNVECAALLKEALTNSIILPEKIVLAHLSQECNTPILAESCTRQMLDENNFTDIKVALTYKNRANEIVRVG